MKIKEIIVVEGKDDTIAVKRAVDADTIETNGSAISKEVLEKIRLAQETRGVIILTDPDYPGQKIRQTIIEHVPHCKHAFISKGDALHKHGKGVGVEHASPEVIRASLSHAHEMKEPLQTEITYDDLIQGKLIGGNGAKRRRERLGQLLRIGYTNGKQLHKRLTMFQISRSNFLEAMETIKREERNE